jgi:hypothetical protein
MANLSVVRATKNQVARPLKVLVPLIQDELISGNEAGMEHYIKAGMMLNEVKDSGQVAWGSWSRWLKDNFHLQRASANDYMRLARKADELGSNCMVGHTIDSALGREPRTIKSVTKKNRLKSLFDVVDKVNVSRLADERRSREDEIKLHRELALKLIDAGYRAMATRLHPDQGGRYGTTKPCPRRTERNRRNSEVCMTTQLVRTSKVIKGTTSAVREHFDILDRARELYLSQIKRAEMDYRDRIQRAARLLAGEDEEVSSQTESTSTQQASA